MPLQTRMHKTHMQRLSCPTGGLPGGAEPSPDATIEASRSARTRPPARLVEQWWLLIQKTNTSASPEGSRDPAFRSWVLKTAEKSRSMSDVSSSPPGLPGGPRRSLPPPGGNRPPGLIYRIAAFRFQEFFPFFLCLGKGDLR